MKTISMLRNNRSILKMTCLTTVRNNENAEVLKILEKDNKAISQMIKYNKSTGEMLNTQIIKI